MARYSKVIFWIGFSFYVVGLFLPGVSGSGLHTSTPLPTIGWSLDSFLFPLIYIHWHGMRAFLVDSTFYHVSVTVTGYINQIFWVLGVLFVIGRMPNATRLLGFLILLMIVFSWFTFGHDHTHPREGYLLWVAGILLALCSTILRRARAENAMV